MKICPEPSNTIQLQKHLETDNLLPISDPDFVGFFMEWCSINRIREYFIIDHNGNFLTIDENGKAQFFIVHTERTLNNFVDLNADTVESKLLIEAAKTREKIPFFGEKKESWEVEHSEWHKCFYTPNILKGREKYYWITLPA